MSTLSLSDYARTNNLGRDVRDAIIHAFDAGLAVGSYATPISPAIVASTDEDHADDAIDELIGRASDDVSLVYVVQ